MTLVAQNNIRLPSRGHHGSGIRAQLTWVLCSESDEATILVWGWLSPFLEVGALSQAHVGRPQLLAVMGAEAPLSGGLSFGATLSS